MTTGISGVIHHLIARHTSNSLILGIMTSSKINRADFGRPIQALTI